MSRMGSTPDSSTRKSKRAQRRARAGGAGAGVSTAGAGAGERGGVVMSQAMDGYRAGECAAVWACKGSPQESCYENVL